MPGAAAALLVLSALAGRAAVPTRLDSTTPILANTNRVPSGRLARHTLTIHLVARTGRWCPEDADGLCLTVAAFGVEGGSLTNPGPLICACEGTEIRATGTPAPLVFQAGVRQRVRFIALPTFGTVTCELRRDLTLERWQPVNKDGADLPPWQTAVEQSRVTISVGEAYDFLYTPAAPGPLQLEVRGANSGKHMLTMAALVR